MYGRAAIIGHAQCKRVFSKLQLLRRRKEPVQEIEDTWGAIDKQTNFIGVCDTCKLCTYIDLLFGILNVGLRARIADLRCSTLFVIDMPIFDSPTACVRSN